MMRKWRSGVGLIFSLGLVLAMGGVASFGLGGGSVARADSPAFKVTLCHATDADNNPYTRNTVSFNSIADADDVNGHGDHTGPIWVAGDQAEKVKWGDIIPEYYYPTGVPSGSTLHYTGMNWTTAGQAIWNNACNIPGPTPPPTERKAVVVTTTVFDAMTKAVWAGTETAPASAYDTARVVAPSVFPVPTGTVTYVFYSTGNCVSATALGTYHSTVTLAAGAVPNSNTESDLGAGSYSFKAIYSGDGNYLGKASACEPFSVMAPPPAPVIPSIQTACGGSVAIGGLPEGWHLVVEPGDHFYGNGTFPLTLGSYNWQLRDASQNDQNGTGQSGQFTISLCPVTISTTVFDASTNAAWAGTEQTGASAYDTSMVVALSAIPVPTGTVTYTFYTNNTCTGDGTSAGTRTLTAMGLVSKSDPESNLAAGSYAFKATYNGDSYYNSKISECEPFTVAAAQVTPTPSPTPTGGVEAATATATGGVLAATGGSTPDQSFGLFLAGMGFLTMVGGAFAWSRREA